MSTNFLPTTRKFQAQEQATDIQCLDQDFETALQLVEVYLKHNILMFENLPKQDDDQNGPFKKGQNKKLFYQVGAVQEGYKLLEKHNGFFLSDVVGSGKTIVGTLIAKKIFYTKCGCSPCPKFFCAIFLLFSSIYGFPHFSFHCFFVCLHLIVKIV